MYNYDIDILVSQLLPPILRRPIMIAWCRIMIWLLQQLWDNVLAHYGYIDNIISCNSQVIYLQHRISEEANCTVEIVDNNDILLHIYWYKIADESIEEQYLYAIGQENNPLYESNYIFNNYDYLHDADYIIRLGPLTDDTKRIANDIANMYNPAGRHYRIDSLTIYL